MTMTNPYIAGHEPGFLDSPLMRTDELFSRSGRNLGNLLFASSVRRVVKTTTPTHRMALNLGVIARECDGIVIPAANWLQSKKDMADMAAQIEKADVPTVILGLGAQATNNETIPELQPGMIRFVKAIADRCDSISVRGTYSAEVLNHYGIKNVTVTGCPSLLWHLRHSARVSRMPAGGQPLRVTVAPTLPNVPQIPRTEDRRMKLARFLLRDAVARSHDTVAQAEYVMIRAARGELAADDPGWDILGYALGNPDRAVLHDYIRRHILAFPDMAGWMAYLANRDLVIGTRLHGIIAALLAGTPAVLLTHDTRTVEMAQFAGVPAMDADSFVRKGRIDPEALLAQADFAAFNKRQVAYFEDFRAYLDKNGVPHHLATPRVS